MNGQCLTSEHVEQSPAPLLFVRGGQPHEIFQAMEVAHWPPAPFILLPDRSDESISGTWRGEYHAVRLRRRGRPPGSQERNRPEAMAAKATILWAAIHFSSEWNNVSGISDSRSAVDIFASVYALRRYARRPHLALGNTGANSSKCIGTVQSAGTHGADWPSGSAEIRKRA